MPQNDYYEALCTLKRVRDSGIINPKLKIMLEDYLSVFREISLKSWIGKTRGAKTTFKTAEEAEKAAPQLKKLSSEIQHILKKENYDHFA